MKRFFKQVKNFVKFTMVMCFLSFSSFATTNANMIWEKNTKDISATTGIAHLVSIKVDIFGTAKMNENLLSEAIEHIFDLSPRGIEKFFELRSVHFRYKYLEAFGHIGRTDIELSWEKANKVNDLLDYINKFFYCNMVINVLSYLQRSRKVILPLF